ncbi:MAG: hypothetical protein BWX54_00551 [Verrucomicrobia bacterium ADurb.Bin018]|nr:MAG: hypothetical protein BWX54_00551 [Verrucomicrobia bacterium ADurb.Bin018]
MPRDSAHPVGATGAMLKFPSALPWLLVLAVAAGVWLGRAGVLPRLFGGRKTIRDRLAQYGGGARARLAPYFAVANLPYPPRRLALVGLKAERQLQVWAAAANGPWVHLRDYPIRGMSGTLGPKLREGDRQVPEGLYRVESLNPNSRYHLALRVNYPNDHDRRRGREDGRTALGSDIMIHGNTCSIGCLAMGNEAAEDLFVLAAETGVENIAVILSPVDFRARDLPADTPLLPPWAGELYAAIRQELHALGGAALNGPSLPPTHTPPPAPAATKSSAP